MEKKQSVEKRAIIQNGIVSIPIGFLCGGPLGAATVAGATALMAHMQEQKDQELRQREWELKHPTPPTIEDRLREEEARKKLSNNHIEIIDFAQKNATIFPYKQYEIKNYSNRSSIFTEVKDTEIPIIFSYNEVESPLLFPTYDKEFFGKVYGINNFHDRLMEDKQKPGFKMYIINAKFGYRNVKYMYTVNGNYYHLF